MKNATAQTPKFKYGDKVRVVNGFYRTRTGRITYYHKEEYIIDTSRWYHFFERETITEPEENLELV